MAKLSLKGALCVSSKDASQYRPAWTKILTLTASLAILSACVSSPSAQFNQRAQYLSFKRIQLQSKGFDLTAFTHNSPSKASPSNTANHLRKLHVYLGGDGQPWLQRHYISKDPTSPKAAILRLMAKDTEHALYLGRPCYHQDNFAQRSSNKKNTQLCQDNRLWTSHRYSEQVVSAMALALSNFQKQNNMPQLTLIGFSGGGTIATLLAKRLQNVEALVTINANLNIDAWTLHHGYSPLSGSINPYNESDLESNIQKHHLIGLKDQNVLSQHWLDRFKQQNNTTIHLFEKYSHNCCWQSVWPEFLNKL